MFGTRLVITRKGHDEGEKPFWISYADLMTALMMLFLVVMAVSLFAITSRSDKYEAEVDNCMAEFRNTADKFPSIQVDMKNHRVNFGERARFAHKDYNLTGDDARTLREFAPVVLHFADSQCGKKLLKRVVVEGYTSKTGSYLYNLDLSLKRAHSVLCALFDAPTSEERPLALEEKQRIRDLFLVGGFSFNANKTTDEESRRVELKLEFWGMDEKKLPKMPVEAEDAPLGSCMLQRR